LHVTNDVQAYLDDLAFVLTIVPESNAWLLVGIVAAGVGVVQRFRPRAPSDSL
jgi:hypothetical protein